MHSGTWKCLDAHLQQDQGGISNSCSLEMSRYEIHVTVFKKIDLFPADVNPINSCFVLMSLVIRRCFCLVLFPGKCGRVVQQGPRDFRKL